MALGFGPLRVLFVHAGLYPTYGLEFLGSAGKGINMRYRRVRIEGGSYFFTVVTYKRKPIFEDADTVALLRKSISDVRAAHPFEIPAQVILHDHLHAIWTLPDGESDFPMRWRQIKAAFRRAMNDDDDVLKSKSRAAKAERTIWQRRYWEHVIRGDTDLTAHVEYIHFNPVKHGLATRPRDWPHSTFLDWVARGLYELNWGADDAPDFSEIVGVE